MKRIDISTSTRRGFIATVAVFVMAIALPQPTFAQSTPLVRAWHQNIEEGNVASTKEVLDRHLKAFGARDLDGIMADYAPDVVVLSPGGVFSPDGILKGKAAVRNVFHTVFAEFGKPGMSFNLKQVSIDGEYAYIVWSAETADNIYEPASDTFVFRDGKIIAQTFAAKITTKR